MLMLWNFTLELQVREIVQILVQTAAFYEIQSSKPKNKDEKNQLIPITSNFSQRNKLHLDQCVSNKIHR